ncbi:MAG: AraC family transcriptional regulator [Candidatus Azobacteroides sp.]|nr:AraC family transcriptional regulator [Candidatus Azobacteroides sp.]
MKSFPQYTFFRSKYGEELLIDVVELKDIKKYLFDIQVHSLTYYDITFITEGSGFFHIDDRKYEICPGDIIFSVPGEVRCWDIYSIQNGYALIFEEEFLLSFFKDPAFIRRLSYFRPEAERKMTLAGKARTEILPLLGTIRQEIEIYQPQHEHILRAVLYEVLMRIDRAYKQYGPPLPLHAEKAFSRHMNRFASLLDKEWSSHRDVAYYADKLCLTTGYLNEIVNQVYGVSAKKYIRQRVMQEAKKLLKYTSLPIVEISERLNFNTDSYFIRYFREYEGVTPLKYRNQKE